MGRPVETLKCWFRSLRDTHTRLDKKKSGDGSTNLTEREEWVLTKFAFLKSVIRHRPEPLQSLRSTIHQHSGDLAAAESACAELQLNEVEESTPGPSQSSTASSSRKRSHEDDILESLHKRVEESGIILKDITKSQQQPLTARTAFVNYVRDSLLTMAKSAYKKARHRINNVLSDLLDDSDNDSPFDCTLAPSVRPVQPLMQHSTRPSSAPPFDTCDQYSSWGSQTYVQMPPPAHDQQQLQPLSHQQSQQQYLQPLQQQLGTPSLSSTLCMATGTLTNQSSPQASTSSQISLPCDTSLPNASNF